MKITPSVVAEEKTWVQKRATVVVPLINTVREDLGKLFNTSVDTVSEEQFATEVNVVFASCETAVNIPALIRIRRELAVENDYPGFIVDEILGRELAWQIAGGQPFRLLAEATFHFADVTTHYDEETAGVDDLHASLAAGFQTRLPGWNWTEGESPFTVNRSD
jgi:hypothetical protein